MDRAELYELWQADSGQGEQNKDRPGWVRDNREAIHEHTDLSEPIPDGSKGEVRKWLKSYKGTVTRQLNPDTDGDGGGS